MDKLIEAAQGLIALGPPERAQDQLWSTWQKRVKAYNLLVAAAVHAHDAGTDEELRKARVQDAFDKIASANTVTICSLDEMESIVNRALDGEFDADLRVPLLH